MSALGGRMNQATYWFYLLVVAAVFAAALAFASKPPGILELMIILLGVPRLHDIGLSGWFVLVGFGIELFGLVIGLVLFPVSELQAMSGLFVFVLAGLLIWLGCVKGDLASNEWGDPPPCGVSFGKPRSSWRSR